MQFQTVLTAKTNTAKTSSLCHVNHFLFFFSLSISPSRRRRFASPHGLQLRIARTYQSIVIMLRQWDSVDSNVSKSNVVQHVNSTFITKSPPKPLVWNATTEKQNKKIKSEVCVIFSERINKNNIELSRSRIDLLAKLFTMMRNV